MTFFTHTFEAKVTEHAVSDAYNYTVVYLPKTLHAELPLKKHPRLRVDAEINDYPIAGAFQPARGKYYLMLSKRFLKSAGLAIGDKVEVRFRVADQEEVNVPEELEAALKGDRAARTFWKSLSAGKRRGMAHRVESAKRAETRARRVVEIMEALAKNEVIGPPPRKKRKK